VRLLLEWKLDLQDACAPWLAVCPCVWHATCRTFGWDRSREGNARREASNACSHFNNCTDERACAKALSCARCAGMPDNAPWCILT
jgi:hypothetical protein